MASAFFIGKVYTLRYLVQQRWLDNRYRRKSCSSLNPENPDPKPLTLQAVKSKGTYRRNCIHRALLINLKS